MLGDFPEQLRAGSSSRVETINTSQAMRYRNSILGQAEYSFSRRSAFTFSGSYGLLHFTGTGYFNSTMVDGQAGYDYLLDPSNSIAILASYGRIDYTGTGISSTGTSTIGTGNSVQDYVGALAYGRKITGRLAFQVAAGPQEILFTGAGGVGNFHLLFASVNSALTYERRRSGLSFSYGRGLTGGSGVFLGATSNTFSGSAHYQFTRFWTGSRQRRVRTEQQSCPSGRRDHAIRQLVCRREPWPAGRAARAGQFQLRRDEAEQSRYLPGGQLRRNRPSTNDWNVGKLASAPGRLGRL